MRLSYIKLLTPLLACMALALLPHISMAKEKGFSCGTSTKQIWSIYQEGDKLNVGSLHQDKYRTWVTQQGLFGIDEKVLEAAWYGTGDYSRERELDSPWMINKAYSEIIALINDQCTIERNYDNCSTKYNSIGTCIAFYNERYNHVIGRLSSQAKALMKKYKQPHLVRKAALSDFKIPKQNLIVIGSYISDPMFVSEDLGIDDWGFEQANYLTENYMAGYESTQIPTLTKGEFEKSTDYQKRLKKLQEDYKNQNKRKSVTANKIYTTIFSNYLNNLILPNYDHKRIKYDADQELFPLTIQFNNDDRTYDMVLKSPFKNAKKLKQDLVKIPDQDNDFLGTWVIAERTDEHLYIKGAYLAWMKDTDNTTLHRLTLVNEDKDGIEIGTNTAEVFGLAYKKELKKRRVNETQRTQRTAESRCKAISNSASSRTPEKYWFIMQINGCM